MIKLLTPITRSQYDNLSAKERKVFSEIYKNMVSEKEKQEIHIIFNDEQTVADVRDAFEHGEANMSTAYNTRVSNIIEDRLLEGLIVHEIGNSAFNIFPLSYELYGDLTKEKFATCYTDLLNSDRSKKVLKEILSKNPYHLSVMNTRHVTEDLLDIALTNDILALTFDNIPEEYITPEKIFIALNAGVVKGPLINSAIIDRVYQLFKDVIGLEKMTYVLANSFILRDPMIIGKIKKDCPHLVYHKSECNYSNVSADLLNSKFSKFYTSEWLQLEALALSMCGKTLRFLKQNATTILKAFSNPNYPADSINDISFETYNNANFYSDLFIKLLKINPKLIDYVSIEDITSEMVKILCDNIVETDKKYDGNTTEFEIFNLLNKLNNRAQSYLTPRIIEIIATKCKSAISYIVNQDMFIKILQKTTSYFIDEDNNCVEDNIRGVEE